MSKIELLPIKTIASFTNGEGVNKHLIAKGTRIIEVEFTYEVELFLKSMGYKIEYNYEEVAFLKEDEAIMIKEMFSSVVA